MLTRLANRAVRDILVETKCVVREFSMALTSGTDSYTLDADVLVMLELWNETSTDNYSLDRITLDEINEFRYRFESTTPPSRYYALAGADLLLVYPTPGSGETLKGQYVPKPTEMSTGANDPSTITYGGIPVEYHDAIIAYMLWWSARYDNHQPSGFGAEFRNEYVAWLGKIRKNLNYKGGNRMPRAVPNRRWRNRYVVSDPSIPIR